MNLACCGGDIEHVGSYRSKDLALFYLFNVSRADAFSLLSIMEETDPTYRRTTSAVVFADKFCRDYKETFLYLFRLYFKLIVPKQIIKYTVTAPVQNIPDQDFDDDLSQVIEPLNPDEKVASAVPEPISAIITEEIMPYHYMICFLLVVMTLPEGELTTWLYWLSYPAQDRKPDHNSMEELIGELWPTTEKNKAKVILMKKKAQNLLIITDVDDLGANKLRLFDANTGGSWTRPIRNLRKELRSKTLGYFFWRRISATIGAECANIDNAYKRLQEPYKLSRWGKKNIALTGERKAARKDVRVFVRLHLSYLHMLNDSLDGGTGSERSSRRGSSYKSSEYGEDVQLSVLQSLYLKLSAPFILLKKRTRKLLATSAQVFPMSGSGSLKRNKFGNSSASAKLAINSVTSGNNSKPIKSNVMRWLLGSGLFRGRRSTVLQSDDANVNKEEFISLEVKYKDALSLPVEEVYHRVETAQARAARLLAQCDDEIHFTTLDLRRDGSDGSTHDRVDYQGRVPRDVVVDVSSSSGSRSRSGSGSSSRSGSGSWEADSRYNQHNQSIENNSVEELQTYITLDSNEENVDVDMNSSLGSARDNPPKLKGIMKKR